MKSFIGLICILLQITIVITASSKLREKTLKFVDKLNGNVVIVVYDSSKQS